MRDRTRTPIVDVVRAMHAAEDAGRDPYNTAKRPRDPVAPQSSPEQRREAAAVLECFETVLTLED